MLDIVGEFGHPYLTSEYLGSGMGGWKSTSLILVDLNKTFDLESTDLLLPVYLLEGL